MSTPLSLGKELDRWRQERERLKQIEKWVREGFSDPAPAQLGLLRPALGVYCTAGKTGSFALLSQERVERDRETFVRLFSVFEQDFKRSFAEFLAAKCALSPVDIAAVESALPEAISAVVSLAVSVNAKAKPLLGRINKLRDLRNRLVHNGFQASWSEDLEQIVRDLESFVAAFS